MSDKPPKLVVVGDGGVGKTSIIVRYTRDNFNEGYEPTLEDHYQANITCEDGSTLQLEIADTAGQEDYKALRDKFMAEGDAFLVVYSIIDSRSLQMADNLLEQISVLKENAPFKFVLCGNKCDMEAQRQVPKTDGKNLADKYKGEFLETSALNKANINEAFQTIGRLLKANDVKDGGCCQIA